MNYVDMNNYVKFSLIKGAERIWFSLGSDVVKSCNVHQVAFSVKVRLKMRIGIMVLISKV